VACVMHRDIVSDVPSTGMPVPGFRYNGVALYVMRRVDAAMIHVQDCYDHAVLQQAGTF
jgi:hypothetical protein